LHLRRGRHTDSTEPERDNVSVGVDDAIDSDSDSDSDEHA
jgi:hypothetical protein